MAKDTPPNDSAPVEGVIVERKATIDVSKIPYQLQEHISFQGWANSLVNGESYTEPDPEYLSRTLMLATLTATTPEEVMQQAGIKKLQEAIPNVPGAGLGNCEIDELYVTDSDYGEGMPTYIIFRATDQDTGFSSRYTTGASQLQAQMLTLVRLGQYPIRGSIRRTDRKDKGGRYLFWLFPPD